MSRRKQARPNKVKDDEELQDLTKGIALNSSVTGENDAKEELQHLQNDEDDAGTEHGKSLEANPETGHSIIKSPPIEKKKAHLHSISPHHHIRNNNNNVNHHNLLNKVGKIKSSSPFIGDDEDSRNNNTNTDQDGRRAQPPHRRDSDSSNKSKHNSSTSDKESEEKEALTASIHTLLGNIMMQQQWPASNGSTAAAAFQSQYSINPTIEFAASALESNPSIQDLTVLQQTLLTLQQQQLLQLQLIQQLQSQLNPQSEGSDEDNEEDVEDEERMMAGRRSASSEQRTQKQRERRRAIAAEPNEEMDDRGEDVDGDERCTDQDKLSPQSQKPKQQQEQSTANNGGNSTVKCSNSNGDGLSPHFATLLNCHNHQDPNQPLSPGLQSSFDSDGLGPGNGMDGQSSGMSGGLGSLNSLEMLQKRAEEVLDSASQGLLQSSLGADDMRKKSGDKNSREPFFKHRCRYCGKVFGSDSALQIHIRSHTGERPFKCNVCGSRFTTKGNLKVHFQRHTSKFPHVKMNPHPVPEHLDRFHPPLIASGDCSPEPPSPPPHTQAPQQTPPGSSASLISGAHHLPSQASLPPHLPLPIPFNNFANQPQHPFNQMWRLVGVAERMQNPSSIPPPTSAASLLGGPRMQLMNSLAGLSMPQDLSKKQPRRKNEDDEESERESRRNEMMEDEDDHDTDEHEPEVINMKQQLIKKVAEEINRRRHSINSNSVLSRGSGSVKSQSFRSENEMIKQEVLDESEDDGNESNRSRKRQVYEDTGNTNEDERMEKEQDDRCTMDTSDSIVKDEKVEGRITRSSRRRSRSRNSQLESGNFSGRVTRRSTAAAAAARRSRSRSRSSGSTNLDHEHDRDACGRDRGTEGDDDSSFDQPENLSSKSLPLMYPLPLKPPERPSSLNTSSQQPSSELFNPALSLDSGRRSDPARDPAIYTNMLPRPGSNDNAWESLIEVTRTSETTKLQQLVDNIEHKLTDPNQCIVCHRVLSCKSALQMHYRTHTGERPFKCKICGRAFTTKGNLKTHMGVHRAKPPLRVLHQCPVCHKRFTNSLVLQQHIRLHTGEPTDLTLDQIRAAEVREPFSPPVSTFHPPNFHGPSQMFHPGTGRGSPGSAGPNAKSPQLSTDSTSTFSTSLAALENQVRTITTTFANSTNVVPDDISNLINLRRQRMLMRMMAQNGMDGTSPIDSLMNSEDEDMEEDEDMGGEDDGGGSSPMSGISSSDWVFEHPRAMIAPSPFPTTPLDLTSGSGGGGVNTSHSHGGSNARAPTGSPSTMLPAPKHAASSGRTSKSSAESNTTLPKSPASVIVPPLATTNSPGPTFLSFIHAGHHPFNLVHPRPPDYTSMWNAAVGTRGNTTCNICLKTFACNSALEIHYRSHTKERPFKCNVCDRGFSTKGNMKQHMLTHKIRDMPNTTESEGDDGSRSAVSCSGDSRLKRSSSESSIPPSGNSPLPTPASKKHESRSSAERETTEMMETSPPSRSPSPATVARLASPKTPTSSITSPGLPQERAKTVTESDCSSNASSTSPRLHDNHLPHHQPPHYQSNAPKQIPSQTTMLSCNSNANRGNSPCPLPVTSPNANSSTSDHHHNSSHSNCNSSPQSQQPETKHICEVCHKSFSSSSSVNIHMRTHTGDKPFKCSVCSKAFTTKGNLKVHMGTHMWTNGLSRRGRRMSLELSLPFPAPPPHHPAALGTIKDHHHLPPHHRPDLFFPFQSAHPLILKNGHQPPLPPHHHPKVMELAHANSTAKQPQGQKQQHQQQPEQEAIV